MKEVMAIIRMNMVNATKTALANAGYPAFFCRKCLGRGKKGVNMRIAQSIIESDAPMEGTFGEHLSEYHRLIAKRMFTLIVDDEQVEDVVKIIIEANQTGNPGDGRVFIIPVTETYNVRTGQALKKAN
jgi:nitrogen regulatory protein PII 2